MKSNIVLTIGLNHEISLIKYSHGRLLDKMKYKTFFKKKYKCILKRVTGEVSQLNGWTFNNFSPLTITCAKINLHLPLPDVFSWRPSPMFFLEELNNNNKTAISTCNYFEFESALMGHNYVRDRRKIPLLMIRKLERIN